MGKVYHLDLTKAALRGARYALLPGDPDRVASIARTCSELFAGASEKLAAKREFTTWSIDLHGTPVLVTSTGIGGPSASIAVDELAQLGVDTFIRVGTTGSIQKRLKNGDCVVTTGSVRLDGASTHYAPIEFPAVAHHDVVAALIEGATKAGVRFHTGISASSDTFYPGEERDDSYRKYILRRFRGATRELCALGVLNYEMESSTVLTLTASMGLRGGCVTGVVNRAGTGRITAGALKKGERSATLSALYAVESLIEKDKGGKGKASRSTA